MEMRSFATCLNVTDVSASGNFMKTFFGFSEEMAFDGLAALTHPQTGMKLVYHKIGLEVLPPGFRHQAAHGVILAFIVDNIEAEYARLKKEGVIIVIPLRTEPWGEKLFLVKCPGGVLIEIAEWNRG